MQLRIRNFKPISLAERMNIREQNQLSGFLEYDKSEDWWLCEVKPQMLRIVHDDFRGEPLIKGELIGAYLSRVRNRIDPGDFPFSDDIRRKWPNKPPLYVLQTKHNSELYVYDGQKRTLNACYNFEKWVLALLVKVDEERDVL